MDCSSKKANSKNRPSKKNNKKETIKNYGKYNKKSARIQEEKRLKRNLKINPVKKL